MLIYYYGAFVSCVDCCSNLRKKKTTHTHTRDLEIDITYDTQHMQIQPRRFLYLFCECKIRLMERFLSFISIRASKPCASNPKLKSRDGVGHGRRGRGRRNVARNSRNVTTILVAARWFVVILRYAPEKRMLCINAISINAKIIK